jgi:ribosomal protein S12
VLEKVEVEVKWPYSLTGKHAKRQLIKNSEKITALISSDGVRDHKKVKFWLLDLLESSSCW